MSRTARAGNPAREPRPAAGRPTNSPPASARSGSRVSSRVSIAGLACYRPGDRPHLFCTLRAYRSRKGEPKGFSWQDYRALIIATHQNLSAPLIWCWDNLNVHLAPELAEFAAGTRLGCGSTGCPLTRRTSIPPRASGRCSSGPWPTSPPQDGYAFGEKVRRASDFAMVEVAASVRLAEDGRTVTRASAVVGGVADKPFPLDAGVLAPLADGTGTETELGAVGAAAADSVSPEPDVHASGAYRKRLTDVLTRRTLAAAIADARSSWN